MILYILKILNNIPLIFSALSWASFMAGTVPKSYGLNFCLPSFFLPEILHQCQSMYMTIVAEIL